ncbi:MAG: 30S ribosomal protein S6 [Phycisphaerales bacterium]|jgi:small subunit ribosomal protein S6
MAKNRVYNYEAMFLLSQAVAADLNAALDHIREIVARGHGEIIAMRKWDERRLAYEIDGQKRGYYVLVYFKAPGPNLAHIERDCNLSEKIMRTLITRCDHLTLEQIQSADARKELELEAKMRQDRPVLTPAAPAAAPAEAAPVDEAAEAPQA